MKRLLGALAIPLVVIAVWLAGALVVGSPPEAGRTSRSTTRVGHKGLALLLERLGCTVGRFEESLDALPTGPAVLIALEPGPLLFRDAGAHAAPLLHWIEAGNAALITLGTDPDRKAEEDDREDDFGTQTGRAIASLRRLESNARARERGEAPKPTPTKGVSGSEAPAAAPPKPDDEAWSTSDLSAALGVALAERRAATTPCTLEGPLAAALGEEPRAELTRPRTFARSSAEVLLTACGDPVLIRIGRGRGEVLVLSEPRLLHNAKLGKGAHAALAVRALEHLGRAAGTRRVLFEEWSHGARAVPNAFALLTRTGARWTVAQLLLSAVVFAFAAARRRTPVPFERPPARRKRETIEATARLLERTGDLAGAGRRLFALTRARTAREGGRREIAEPPATDTPAALIAMAVAARKARLSTRGRGPS